MNSRAAGYVNVNYSGNDPRHLKLKSYLRLIPLNYSRHHLGNDSRHLGNCSGHPTSADKPIEGPIKTIYELGDGDFFSA